MRENSLSPRWGLVLLLLESPGLRPGLHSCAATRLAEDERLHYNPRRLDSTADVGAGRPNKLLAI